MEKTKLRSVLVLGLILVLTSMVLSSCSSLQKEDSLEQIPTIRISGAWALYPMMVVWADEYQKTHNVVIELAGGGAGKGISDVLNGQVDIGMVSRPIREEELEQEAFYIATVKDSVVAVVNEDNPVLMEIYEQGLSQEDLKKIFLKETVNWGEIVGKDMIDDQITVYGRADASGAAKVWASFLGDYTQSDLQDQADANFSGDQPVAAAVEDEKNAIGFTNLNYAYSIETGKFAEKIRPVPVDLNNNNRLNAEESFYDNRDMFIKSVSEGKYPSPPARRDYVVGKGSFTAEVKEFIKWILTDGQKYVVENGYVKLANEELKEEINYLEDGKRRQ
ncbi:PstS family phosphate ABC transporter substrate-binding protein [Iocasia frigidifontis]|nr:substrate-binding domain-containing protein [Iocasia fonsfrigidae]